MNEELVLVERNNSIATVTLNRPDAMNALSREHMIQLAKIFRDLQKDDSIAVVILTGAGRAFCAGLDLKQLADFGLDAFTLSGELDIRCAVLDFDRPIIGAINGVAATGGFEMALWCDVLIASTREKFIDTHTRVGLISGWGLSQYLQRLIGANRAREFHFTGNPISAEQAERWGLVNRVVEPDDLISTCMELAEDMVSCHIPTQKKMKRVIRDGGEMTLGAALDYENLAMKLHGETVQPGEISDRVEAIQSRSRKRARR